MIRAVDLIRAERDGAHLKPDQIRELIDGIVARRIPDYQAAAWLMAVYFTGLNAEELAALTDAMMRSGEVYDFSAIPGVKADKHSTGGVGDKVSLILAPLAAACGLVVPMVAGRGLGHTGGTLDKLESIPGFTTRLSAARFKRQLGKIGVAIGGQTRRFVPADRRLYALRDVTATVESIPLIAASIMSKKLAEGCEILVLDVKTGNGAFMAKRKDALLLAKTMTAIGRRMGRKVSAMITDMSQPLGRAIGNANEVAEAIECLRGGGPEDLMRVTYALTARMLTVAGAARGEAEAGKMMREAIASGRALEKFRALVTAQGGDLRCVDDPRRLPRAPKRAVVKAPRTGFVVGFQTRQIGVAASILGAGRAEMTDKVDHGVGLLAMAKIGDKVAKGQPVFEIVYRDKTRLDQALPMLKESVTISSARKAPPRLIAVKEA